MYVYIFMGFDLLLMQIILFYVLDVSAFHREPVLYCIFESAISVL